MFLPKAKRKYIAAIYAFARTADDYADEPGDTSPQRLEKLSLWEEHLSGCYRGEAVHPIFIALRETAETFGIPQELFQRLLNAFVSDTPVRNIFRSSCVLPEFGRARGSPGTVAFWLHGRIAYAPF